MTALVFDKFKFDLTPIKIFLSIAAIYFACITRAVLKWWTADFNHLTRSSASFYPQKCTIRLVTSHYGSSTFSILISSQYLF